MILRPMDQHHHGGDQAREEDNTSHEQKDTDRQRVERPQSGSTSYGWLWIVGIIIVVAVVLFFMQRSVPDASAPAESDVTFVDEDGNEVDFTVEVPFDEPGVYNVSAPTAASHNAIIGLAWDVSALEETTISRTSVQWGTTSGDYTRETDQYLEGTFTIPAHFEANIRPPEGAEALFGRAVAEIDGEEYVSEEFTITINR